MRPPFRTWAGCYEINTYDQPAVQLGKDATYALMGKEGFADLAKKIEPVAKRDKKVFGMILLAEGAVLVDMFASGQQ